MVEYPEEVLDESEDDGSITGNVQKLRESVIGRRIVSVEKDVLIPDTDPTRYYGSDRASIITLDDGTEVRLRNTGDCCAFTELEAFLLHPERVEHAILGVGTTDGYTKWHIYADFGDIVELTVGWSPGNPFYYGYGFDIEVEEIPSIEPDWDEDDDE